jgi:uncharacterized oxidoreductase
MKGGVMSDSYYFPPDRLRQTVNDLCRASGSPQTEAELVAERLVKSDLTGHPSHGVIRMPMYLQMIRAEMIRPGAVPEICADFGSTAVLNGNRAYGQVAAEKAARVAIERGRAHGVAAVGVNNLGHIGRLADYAVAAAQANCMGLVFASGGGGGVLVAPFEGSSRRMSTNPLAVAIPSDREYPIVFDMATSVWAEGKLRVLRASGTAAPERTLLDKEGRPTTDAEDFYAGGAILPLGGRQGYKGYLLNFMVEVLAGLLTGGGYVGRDENAAFSNCTMIIVIDVSRFRELPAFKSELEDLIKYLQESPVQEGKQVLYPGELEARREAELLTTGIPLAANTVNKIQEELDTHSVAIRLSELGQSSPLSG